MANNIHCPGPRCCCCKDPFGDGTRVCCNADGGCRRFFEKCRDCFWPFFSHPRWVRCGVLYSCCDPCNAVVHDEHHHHH